MPYDALSDICSHVPALQESLMRLIGQEITAEQELLLSVNRRQAVGRVAAFLLALSHRYQRLHYSAKEFRLTMSRYELGNYLGLTIETVSRAVSRLQQEELIAVDRRSVRIINPGGLQDICNGEQVAVSLYRSSA
jgi:CRP/FNR family transcriptional regulator